MSDHPKNMAERPDDLLSSILTAYRLQAGVYASPTFCRDWQFGTMGDGHASFHVVSAGECWLHMRAPARPVLLSAGDWVLLPHDDWHLLNGSRTLQDSEIRMVMGMEGSYTSLLCGYVRFVAGWVNPILTALPPLMLIRGADTVEALKLLSSLMICETRNQAIGTKAVIDRLGDTLFVMMLRQYLSTVAEPGGLLAALADERIRRALDCIHRDPLKDWTVGLLADAAGMSRSAFTNRFGELLGATPKEYAIRWRMTQAELMLQNPNVTVAEVADRSGYECEASFRKAFKRLFGRGPGKARSK
jgi:AraC family transcriptional activator of mtrCDE